MQEVQALCDRVVIIDRGTIVADDPIDRLQRRLSGDSSLLVQFDRQVENADLLKINGVDRVTPGKLPFSYRLFLRGEADARADVFRFAVAKDLVLLGMVREELSVEEVFRALTATR